MTDTEMIKALGERLGDTTNLFIAQATAFAVEHPEVCGVIVDQNTMNNIASAAFTDKLIHASAFVSVTLTIGADRKFVISSPHPRLTECPECEHEFYIDSIDAAAA